MINIIPENDEKEHVLDFYCECKPAVTYKDNPKGPLITHNSFDCREFVERQLGENLGRGKGWVTVFK